MMAMVNSPILTDGEIDGSGVVSRKSRIRAHSFSFSFFSSDNSSKKNERKSNKSTSSSSSKKIIQANLNEKMPALPFQYSPKITHLNSMGSDSIRSNNNKGTTDRKHSNNNKHLQKRRTPTCGKIDDEFGCRGVTELEFYHQNGLSTPNLMLNKGGMQTVVNKSDPLQHSACQIFQDQDEDSMDMATLLDHTLMPVITGAYNYLSSNKPSDPSSSILSSTNSSKLSSANFSPPSSSSSCSNSCSSTSETCQQPETPQTPMSALPPINTMTTTMMAGKSAYHARSLPSLRSAFTKSASNTNTMKKRPFNTKNKENNVDEFTNQNSLGLQLNVDVVGKPLERSPLRERRRKPPLSIDASKVNTVVIPISTFSSASETYTISDIPSNRSSLTLGVDKHFSILSPKLIDSNSPIITGNLSSPITPISTTLRSRRSKISLLSPPPCPPPATPLPDLPSLMMGDNTTKRISTESGGKSKEVRNSIKVSHQHQQNRESKSSSIETSLPYLTFDKKKEEEEEATSSSPLPSKNVNSVSANETITTETRQHRGLSYNSTFSAQDKTPHSHLSVISIDSFKTASPSSIKNTNAHNSNRSSIESNQNNRQQSATIHQKFDEKVIKSSLNPINDGQKEIQNNENEKSLLLPSSSEQNPDLHIIGLAF